MPYVIVTGGAGFVGSHLVDALLAEGHDVLVIDDLSAGDASNVDPRADLEVFDIADRSALDAALGSSSPVAIFHLAAQASVTASVTDPHRDCEVNVQGTLNLLEAAGRFGAPLIFSSTGGALYGNDAPIPTPETRIPSPLAPYGASKWAAEAYVRSFANSSRLAHTVCRLGNVYGPRQSPHGEAGVVAIFSHALWQGEQPRLFGYGKATRDYVHVADVASAMLRASGAGRTFNVATGIETPVSEVWSMLQRAAGTDIEPELLPLREGELERSCMDPSLAAEVLGWRAEVPLEDGMGQTYSELVAGFEASPV